MVGTWTLPHPSRLLAEGAQFSAYSSVAGVSLRLNDPTPEYLVCATNPLCHRLDSRPSQISLTGLPESPSNTIFALVVPSPCRRFMANLLGEVSHWTLF